MPTCPGWTNRDLLIHLGGVHRWAATHVAEQRREPFPEDYTAPADGLLTGFLARRPERLAADPPLSVALHATDIDRAWTIRMTPDGLRVTTTGQPDGPSLTGTASDLYLYVWNRIGADRLSAHGDQQVWTLWREKAIVTVYFPAASSERTSSRRRPIQLLLCSVDAVQ